MRNALLYNKLKAQFGKVLISREGREDEDYRVCCPFCSDTRHRLYISCKWGVYDPATGCNDIGRLQCYNEHCFQLKDCDHITYEERLERRKAFFMSIYHGTAMSAVLAPPTKELPSLKEPLAWPGKVIRLDKLFAKKPDHLAVKYMQSRGFDPVQLGKEYGFVFCDKVTDPKYALALGTILMPIYYKGELRSWISRYIGDIDPNDPFAKKIKKYYNCPDRPLQSVGYRLDVVAQYSTVVLVEGILDAIKTGPFATPLLTKNLNQALKKKILRGLQQYGDDAVAVIMLDPDQNEKEKGMPHHIEVVAAALEESVKTLPVYLPSGYDPGKMTTENIMQHILKAAEKAKIKLNFNKQH